MHTLSVVLCVVRTGVYKNLHTYKVNGPIKLLKHVRAGQRYVRARYTMLSCHEVFLCSEKANKHLVKDAFNLIHVDFKWELRNRR